MPLPEPTYNEMRGDFIERCMRDDNIENDFDTQEQRLAVCAQQWENKGIQTMKKTGSWNIKELKDEGTGTAVFATLNAVDKDGDFTLPNAFGEQKAKLVAAHDWSAAPIGVANIREVGNEAIADFSFNLSMESAKEWYESLKFSYSNGVTQEFSYGFDILEEDHEAAEQNQAKRGLKKLKVHEVSPVMIGAGNGTRLVGVKSSGQRLEDHFAQVLEVNQELVERVEGLVALRAEKGRGLSSTNKARMDELLDSVITIDSKVRSLVRGEILSTETNDEIELLKVKAQRLMGRLRREAEDNS